MYLSADFPGRPARVPAAGCDEAPCLGTAGTVRQPRSAARTCAASSGSSMPAQYAERSMIMSNIDGILPEKEKTAIENLRILYGDTDHNEAYRLRCVRPAE